MATSVAALCALQPETVRVRTAGKQRKNVLLPAVISGRIGGAMPWTVITAIR